MKLWLFVSNLSVLWRSYSESNLNHLKYKFFTKKHLESSKLPPTEDSALYHVKRANYQCFIWKHVRNKGLSVTSSDGNGWTKDEMRHIVSKLLEKVSALESLFELIVCRCIKGWNARCSCRRVRLSCTATCKKILCICLNCDVIHTCMLAKR